MVLIAAMHLQAIYLNQARSGEATTENGRPSSIEALNVNLSQLVVFHGKYSRL